MSSALKTIPYVRQYLSGLLWTLVDSVGSQTLVIAYHFFLRAYTGLEIHGAIGCLYSLLYLSTALANVGLDKSLAPFLELFTSSKKAFLIFLWTLGIQLFFIGTVSTLFVLNAKYLTEHVPVLKSLTVHLSPLVLSTVAVAFFFENFRKTVRTFLQLSFYFRATAFIELFGICGSLCALPFLFYYGSLTVETVFIVHALLCVAQTVFLCGVLFSFYQSLQNSVSESRVTLQLVTRMVKTRFNAWILHCLSQLYSGNFLVPLCVLKFGVSSASLLKVMTSIAYWIALLSKNVFGTTSNAVLAHLKSRSAQTQQEAFHYLSLVANQALYCLIIFLLINGQKILLAQVTDESPISWSLLYFMLLINFFEGFFVLYEKWYILEEDAFIYVLLNAVSLGVLYLIIPALLTAPAILAMILSIRIVTFLAILIVSFYRWKIWPPLKPQPLPIISAILVSGMYYLLA